MTHHELTMENEVLKTNLKKLLEILFMDWKEKWLEEGCGSMSAHPPYEVRNPNPLSCSLHNGCLCDGGEKIRSMFTKKELKEFRSLLDTLQ